MQRVKLKFKVMSDIASRVKAIIVDKLGVDETEVVSEASFTNSKKNLTSRSLMTKLKTSQPWDKLLSILKIINNSITRLKNALRGGNSPFGICRDYKL